MRYYCLLLVLSIFSACQSVPTESENASTGVALANVSDSFQKNATSEETPPPVVAFDSTITDAYLMGQFDPGKDKRFVKVAAKYAKREGMLLRKETHEAFVEMAEAAAEEGLQFYILSATRNFSRQKGIWEAKWSGARKVDGQDLSKTIPDPTQRAQKILQWSSMPGSSRHHWGTDLDINALNNEYFAKGKGLEEYKWLVENAARFGFCQPYSPKGTERPHGYNEEKWHWSYLPLSLPLTQQVKLRLQNKMIKGFKGAESADLINIVDHYVLGINEECK